MQSSSSNDLTAHEAAGEDIKAVWKPKESTHHCNSKAQCRAICWSSVVTIMPSFSYPQPVKWRKDEALLKEEERLAYNKRIETMRQTEYPMLQGMFTPFP
jgi:hypothetical protein